MSKEFEYALALEVLRMSHHPTVNLMAAIGWANSIIWHRTSTTSEITLAAIEHVLLSRGVGRELIPEPWYPAAGSVKPD